jgi:hypothetical protein
MKYMIREEGGFLGFPRDYIGEIPMENNKAIELISVLEEVGEEENSHTVDSMHYIIELEHRGQRFSGAFGEKSLPAPIREFLDTIRDNR